jgi:aminoglycoside 3-N-acetyltransferase
MVKKQDIFNLLVRLKIKRNDIVVVHSALRSVGEIDGGANALIDALIEYLSSGVLVIPTHSWQGIVDRLYYNVHTTETCLGALSKVALEREDGVRSLHPTHSVKAFGKKAYSLIKGEEKTSSPTSKNGWLSKLCFKKAKILLLGVNQNSNTFIHAIEERLNIPDRMGNDNLKITVIGYDGKDVNYPLFNGYYSKNIPEGCSEHFENYHKPLVELGAVLVDKLGNAEVRCCTTNKTYKVIKKLWKNADYDLCITDKEIPEKFYKDELSH